MTRITKQVTPSHSATLRFKVAARSLYPFPDGPHHYPYDNAALWVTHYSLTGGDALIAGPCNLYVAQGAGYDLVRPRWVWRNSDTDPLSERETRAIHQGSSSRLWHTMRHPGNPPVKPYHWTAHNWFVCFQTQCSFWDGLTPSGTQIWSHFIFFKHNVSFFLLFFLEHSRLAICIRSIIWTYRTHANNFWYKYKPPKYILKEYLFGFWSKLSLQIFNKKPLLKRYP